MSETLMLHPRQSAAASSLTLDFEVPSQFVEKRPVTLTLRVDGEILGHQLLVAGANRVVAELPHGTDSVVTLSVDAPYTLPPPDGRSVLGLVKGISTR
jgi:hypothetical protein